MNRNWGKRIFLSTIMLQSTKFSNHPVSCYLETQVSENVGNIASGHYVFDNKFSFFMVTSNLMYIAESI